MIRITEKMLQNKIDYINKIEKRPMQYMTKHTNGNFTINVGNVHLTGHKPDKQRLYRVMETINENGGINHFITSYSLPIRETYLLLQGYVAAIDNDRLRIEEI